MGVIYILSKLRCRTSLFPLRLLLDGNFFVTLHCIRITGNVEERPANVNADAQARSGNTDLILVAAFLFNIIAQTLTSYLTY